MLVASQAGAQFPGRSLLRAPAFSSHGAQTRGLTLCAIKDALRHWESSELTPAVQSCCNIIAMRWVLELLSDVSHC